MKPNNSLSKLGVVALALGAAFLLEQSTCDASSQQQQGQQQSQSQSQSQQQTSPPSSPTPPPSSQPASLPMSQVGELPLKRRKVWSNDDVIQIRTPADSYQIEKEAKEAAETAAMKAIAKAAPKSEKEPPLDIKLPATAEETEKMLKDTQADLDQEIVALDKLHKELPDAPGDQQAGKQREIDRITANLEILRRDMKGLQDHLQALREKSQAGNPPAAPPPPSIQ